MTRGLPIAIVGGLLATALAGPPAQADQLFEPGNWPAVAADRKAGQVGDIVTVLIVEGARASSRLENNSDRSTQVGGGLGAGGIDESADLRFGGSYTGRGEVVRSEQFVAQMTATVVEQLPNGDLIIQGAQNMQINDEETKIGVRGRVRRTDISGDNTVPSYRLADAQIDYDGEGFVSRSAKPGLISRIFTFLGIG